MRSSDWSSDVCSSDLAAQQLGLVLGVGQQILGLLGGIALLALVFGQRLLRFLAQALGLVELGADALGAGVETIEDGLARLPDHQAGEDDEGDGDPECRIVQHQPLPPITLPTARAISWSPAFTPIRFSLAPASSEQRRVGAEGVS